MKYRDKTVTLIQLLENACGAEFEDESLAVSIIEETLRVVASESNDIHNVSDCFYSTDKPKPKRKKSDTLPPLKPGK